MLQSLHFFSLNSIFVIKRKKISSEKRNFLINLFDKNFRLFVIINGLFALGAFSYSFFLLYAKDIGFSIYTVPIFYLILQYQAQYFLILLENWQIKIGRKKFDDFLFFFCTCMRQFYYYKKFIRSCFHILSLWIIQGSYRSITKNIGI